MFANKAYTAILKNILKIIRALPESKEEIHMIPIIAGIVVGVLLIIIAIIGYMKSPPDTAYIISGLGKPKPKRKQTQSVFRRNRIIPFGTTTDKR